MNNCTFSGWLVDENPPEVKQAPSYTGEGNVSVINFTIAVPAQSSNPNHKPMYLRCAMFGSRVEKLAQHLVKKKNVSVAGAMKYDVNTGSPRLYETKDGYAGASFELTVRELSFNGVASGGSASNGNGSGLALRPVAEGIDEGAGEDDPDNLPF